MAVTGGSQLTRPRRERTARLCTPPPPPVALASKSGRAPWRAQAGALTCVPRLLGGTSGPGTSAAEPGLCPRGPHPRPREGTARARSAKPPSVGTPPDAPATTPRWGRVSSGVTPRSAGSPCGRGHRKLSSSPRPLLESQPGDLVLCPAPSPAH